MDLITIFQSTKTAQEIRDIVLKNTVKMLIARKKLNEEPVDSKRNELVPLNNEDDTYSINDLEGNQIIIKVSDQKITSISKQSPMSDFLNKYAKEHKIIIVKGISTKAAQHITSNFTNADVFIEHQMMINLIDHIYAARYEKLEHDTEEFITFREKYQCKKRNIPKLLATDASARYYGLKVGDIVRVIRPSETTGEAPYYRLVV